MSRAARENRDPRDPIYNLLVTRMLLIVGAMLLAAVLPLAVVVLAVVGVVAILAVTTLVAPFVPVAARPLALLAVPAFRGPPAR